MVLVRQESLSGGIEPNLTRTYHCACGKPVYFRNSICLNCKRPLGYEPNLGAVYPLKRASQDGSWSIPGQKTSYGRCGNLDTPATCNWLVPSEDRESGKTLCISCRLNRTIPDLSVPGNDEYWQRIELAKRRLVAALVALRLPVASRVGEDPERGLAFDFLHTAADEKPVHTGHSDGIITLNIEEADDSVRERIRAQMHEPYRTLLGHLRHESGHYYWDRLIAGSALLPEFRKVFGDETQDYAAALQRHYEQGAPSDWPQHYVSAYASTHPWEDWAETWAHYLHMMDGLDTAASFRLEMDAVEMPFEGFRLDTLTNQNAPDARDFLKLVNAWGRLTAVLNEMSRSMGVADFYPFVLSGVAVAKLHLVHTLVNGGFESAGV
jgi:hypothetical protein